MRAGVRRSAAAHQCAAVSASIALRARSSARAAALPGRPAAPPLPVASHRSAGCTRSAPASSCTARYCGNRPPATPACRPARGPGSRAARTTPARSTSHRCASISLPAWPTALQRRLGSARSTGGHGQAHELERAHALVHLVRALRSTAGSTPVDVGRPAPRLLEVAAQRLVRRLERAAQLVVHPGQGAQVVGARWAMSRRGGHGGALASGRGSGDLEPGHRGFSSSAVRDSSRTICAVDRVPSPVCSVTAKMCWMFSATTLADSASRERLRRDAARSGRPAGASRGRCRPARSRPRRTAARPRPHPACCAPWRPRRPACRSEWSHERRDLPRRVAERSASRCTSSATTEKPRPASPADAAWMAAFSASTLVCSVMSEISSVISPISCDDSPSRLMRLEVSWIWSRIAFMPPMVFCTAVRPVSAACSDWRATWPSAAPAPTRR
jgi:hypothetical protein